MWWKWNKEDGQRGGLAREAQQKKKKKKRRNREREREREQTKHMDTGSLALSIHMPSHQMVRSHPGDVATKRTQAAFKSLLPTISSCSHAGRELELRQKFAVREANGPFHTDTHFSQTPGLQIMHSSFFFLIFPFNVTF